MIRELGILIALVGCRSDHAPNEGKRMPKAPPPVAVSVPSELRIEVTVDGAPRPPITAATLAALPPDFADHERRAWRISTLLGLGTTPGSVIAATGAAGMTIELPASDAAGKPTATLFVTRRSEVIVALVDPADPFPAFHGQGRRLERPGDPLPRIVDVSRIAIRSGHQLEPAPPPDERPPL